MKKIISLSLALILTLAFIPAITASAADITVVEIASGLEYGNLNFSFNDGLMPVSNLETAKWGYIDKTGKEIIPCIYDRAASFSEELAVVLKDGECGFVDKEGTEAIPYIYDYADSFSEGLAVVAKEPDGKTRKYGYIDKTGKEIVPCIYDSATSFSEGLANVMKGDWETGKYGYIDKTGKEIVPCIYDSATSFSEGLARVEKDGKYGYIDKTGKEIVPCVYDGADPFSEGLARVMQGNQETSKWGYIDKTGKEIVPHIYDRAGSFREGMAAVRKGDYDNGKWGYIDKTGKEIVPFIYGYADSFHEGLAYVVKGELETGKCGFIDKTGNEVISCMYDVPYATYYAFGGGLAAVIKNDKWGYIDKTGKEVVPFIYNGAHSFNDGLAVVSKDNKLTIFEIISSTADTSNSEQPTVTAISSPQKVLVNGIETPFDAYNIDGSNYFKLRDLAYVLNGTEKQFEVDYDSANNTVSLTLGKAYTVIGGEMAAKTSTEIDIVPATSNVYLEGEKVNLTAYNINGNNYFKLRDIGEVFDFGIDWDGEKNIITIDTSKGYTP